jgi:hypothetical protein
VGVLLVKKIKDKTVSDKWVKHLISKEDPLISKHLPETDLFDKGTLKRFLNDYSVIFLKPVSGSMGSGIIRIKRIKNKYLLEADKKKELFNKKSKLIRSLKQIIRRKKYLVQQGIDLFSIDQRPVDFRVLLLKPGDKWEMMGIMGKWGAPNRIVTNYSKGSLPITLERALKKSKLFTKKQSAQMENKLNVLGFRTAATLSKNFNNVRKAGLDVAIDTLQKPWILEVNTKPGSRLFKHHDDKTLYSKIRKYKKIIKRFQKNI